MYSHRKVFASVFAHFFQFDYASVQCTYREEQAGKDNSRKEPSDKKSRCAERAQNLLNFILGLLGFGFFLSPFSDKEWWFQQQPISVFIVVLAARTTKNEEEPKSFAT